LLIEILKRTPAWVFILFFVLLVYGHSQSKNRTVSRPRIAVLPAAMIVLSFYGVLSAFGIAPVGLASWGIGVGVSVWLGLVLAVPRGVTYSNETQSFFVPGSWLPLILMMAIFFIKYAVGVILARQLPIANTLIFSGSVSFLYGFFGGLFLSRALVVWSSRKRPIEMMSNPPLYADMPQAPRE
jgi:hypothetical protein